MNNQEYTKLKEWLRRIDDKLDNHLVSVGKEIAEIKTDVSWIKKFFWLVITVSTTAIIVAIFSVILR